MDKDSIILRYEQEILDEADEDVSKIKEKNDYQEKKLKEMQEQLLFVKKDLSVLSHKPKIKLSRPNIDIKNLKPKTIDNYDELLSLASETLKVRGISPYDVSIYDMVTEEDFGEILKEINAPLPREDKWTKADFIIVFIAAVIGGFADFVLGNRDNKYTGQKSKFSEWLNENLHEGNHKTNAPIDFQGKHFGGGYHRELSSGHDILRFVDGIKMFKEGKFKGQYFVNGIAKSVVKSKNQFGTPYAQLSTIEALVEYSRHMFADLFSKVSLPIPGYSFLMECNKREVRKFASDLYHGGFNCKNILAQSASTIAIELIIRIYFSIQSVQKYNSDIDVEIDKDYSNFDALKTFVSPPKQEKLNEMLLVAHSIVTGINIGKIAITKDLATINITEIMAVVKYGIKVATTTAKRYDKYAKLMYHTNVIESEWLIIEESINENIVEIIDDEPDLVIA